MSTSQEEQDTLPGDRNFIVALARGLEVLRCFRPEEASLSNHEIASRTGLPKPTISRLTHTLCRLGYLVHLEETGAYRLGPGVLELGYGALASMDIGSRAAAEMQSLCGGARPQVTAALAERHGFDALLMVIHRSEQAITLPMNVGSKLPLFESAMGRAILAGMTCEAREAVVEQACFARPTETTAIRAQVAEALSDFARLGYCTSFGEFVPEMNAIAVPVVSLNGERVYGLNLSGPSFILSADALQREYGERLKEAARALGPSAPVTARVNRREARA
ncbi:IclR family transcriptional regulator [Acuticoccus kandeliae]|uniref:IclR family transcriptional regulator n=1 Tax=Acuticoccus kandeliae TaxID=2073160 RepID=UPI000D3ECF41|nr:IclR family transcriptional regulator [Acuticoccus kandeliae]